MTRDAAFAELTKRWGSKGRWQVGRALSSAERREAAKAALAPLYAERAALNARIEQLDKQARYFKFTVSEQIHPFMSMTRGRGDTWEDAFAAADNRRTGAA